MPFLKAGEGGGPVTRGGGTQILGMLVSRKELVLGHVRIRVNSPGLRFPIWPSGIAASETGESAVTATAPAPRAKSGGLERLRFTPPHNFLHDSIGRLVRILPWLPLGSLAFGLGRPFR